MLPETYRQRARECERGESISPVFCSVQRRLYNCMVNKAEFDLAIAGLPLDHAAYLPTIGSTNDLVAEWARGGMTGLALAAADEQTRGRGRSGRTWHTPAGSALAFSLLVATAPRIAPEQVGLVSGLGAVAVSIALEELYRLEPRIKWPNDVLLHGKKVSGVLPEANWSGSDLQSLVLGIGINVAASSLPPAESLAFPATSVEGQLDRTIDPGQLLRAVLSALIEWRGKIDQPEFIQAWEQRLAYKGELVAFVVSESHKERGEVLGLSADGALRLRLTNGETRAFQMGEIQIRPTQRNALN